MENCKTELRWTLFFFFNEISCAHHCSHFRDPFAKREVLLVGRGWNRVPRRKVFMIYYMEEVLIRIVRGISIFYGGAGVARRWKIRGNVVNSHEGIDVLRIPSSEFSEFIHFHRKTRGSDTLYTKVSPRHVVSFTSRRTRNSNVDG